MNVIEIFIFISIVFILIFLIVLIVKITKAKSNNIESNPLVLDEKFINLGKNIDEQKIMVTSQNERSIETNNQIKNNEKLLDELKLNFSNLKEQDIKTIGASQSIAFTEMTKLIAKIEANNNQISKMDDAIKDMNAIFYNTKRRGNLGEYTLETLLINYLGVDKKIWEKQFQLATSKKNKNDFGEGRVDFIIHTPKGSEDIIIDSKFPMDAYNEIQKSIDNKEEKDHYNNKMTTFTKSLKTHIDEIVKYVNPKNNISSAILYVPSESIFNFITDNLNEVMQHSFNKKIWLTSPTMLNSILNIIMNYSNNYSLNKNLTALKERIENLLKDYTLFETRWNKITKSFDTVKNSIDDFDITVTKIIKQQKTITKFQVDDEQ